MLIAMSNLSDDLEIFAPKINSPSSMVLKISRFMNCHVTHVRVLIG